MYSWKAPQDCPCTEVDPPLAQFSLVLRCWPVKRNSPFAQSTSNFPKRRMGQTYSLAPRDTFALALLTCCCVCVFSSFLKKWWSMVLILTFFFESSSFYGLTSNNERCGFTSFDIGCRDSVVFHDKTRHVEVEHKGQGLTDPSWLSTTVRTLHTSWYNIPAEYKESSWKRPSWIWPWVKVPYPQ